MSFSIKHVKEVQNEFQSIIHREESDLAYTLLADVWGCFSAEETELYLHRDFCWTACTDWVYFLHAQAFLTSLLVGMSLLM